MSLFELPTSECGTRFRPIGIVYILIAIVSFSIVEALQGHACTGTGCPHCIIMAFANVALFVSIVGALSSPIAHFVSGLRLFQHPLWRAFESKFSRFSDANLKRIGMTPVTLRVKLLI